MISIERMRKVEETIGKSRTRNLKEGNEKDLETSRREQKVEVMKLDRVDPLVKAEFS